MTERTEGKSNPQTYMALRLGERRFACDLNHVKGVVEVNDGTYYLINLEHVASFWLERKDPARSGNSVSVGDTKI